MVLVFSGDFAQTCFSIKKLGNWGKDRLGRHHYQNGPGGAGKNLGFSGLYFLV